MVPEGLKQDLSLPPHPLVTAPPSSDRCVSSHLPLRGAIVRPPAPAPALPFAVRVAVAGDRGQRSPLVAPGPLGSLPGDLLRPLHSVPAGPHTPAPAGCTSPHLL